MKIGILGAGVMGQGVAHRFAANEYEVFLVDIEEEILEEALNNIKRNLFLEKMAGKKTIDVNQIMSRIHITTSYEVLNDVDFIVENVPEIVNLKKQVNRTPKHMVKSANLFRRQHPNDRMGQAVCTSADVNADWHSVSCYAGRRSRFFQRSAARLRSASYAAN